MPRTKLIAAKHAKVEEEIKRRKELEANCKTPIIKPRGKRPNITTKRKAAMMQAAPAEEVLYFTFGKEQALVEDITREIESLKKENKRLRVEQELLANDLVVCQDCLESEREFTQRLKKELSIACGVNKDLVLSHTQAMRYKNEEIDELHRELENLIEEHEDCDCGHDN